MNNVNAGTYDSVIPGMSTAEVDLNKWFGEGSTFYYVMHDNSGFVNFDAEIGFGNKSVKASELPSIVKGTEEWDDAVKSIANGGNTSYRTRTATEEKKLLNEARGNMNRNKQYTSKQYKKGYEMHPNEINTRNAPHNDLPHVKWKDWLDEVHSGKGHIFFDSPNQEHII